MEKGPAGINFDQGDVDKMIKEGGKIPSMVIKRKDLGLEDNPVTRKPDKKMTVTIPDIEKATGKMIITPEYVEDANKMKVTLEDIAKANK